MLRPLLWTETKHLAACCTLHLACKPSIRLIDYENDYHLQFTRKGIIEVTE